VRILTDHYQVAHLYILILCTTEVYSTRTLSMFINLSRIFPNVKINSWGKSHDIYEFGNTQSQAEQNFSRQPFYLHTINKWLSTMLNDLGSIQYEKFLGLKNDFFPILTT